MSSPPAIKPQGAPGSVLDTPIRGVTAAERDALAQVGVTTVADVLWTLPRDHRDGRQAVAIRDAPIGAAVTLIVEVSGPAHLIPIRRSKLKIVEVNVTDGTGTLRASFYNQPWLARRLNPGDRLVVGGKLRGRSQFRVSEHRTAKPDETLADVNANPLVGSYPGCDGVTPTRMREIVDKHRGAVPHVPETLPEDLRRAEGLLPLSAALDAYHWPTDMEQREAARRRLAYDEILALQLALLTRRNARMTVPATAPLTQPRVATEQWLSEQLPFKLTQAQERAIEILDRDLAAVTPMARLLMGDVGAGKTVVALYAMLRAAEHGAQACILAPTEALAHQHHQTIQKLTPGSWLRVSLLTGATSAADRRRLLYGLSTGHTELVVGTHALLEPDVQFARLTVAIIDEQHRFGVGQRAALEGKAPHGHAPHTLHMTATPIPRTLALAVHGDLDVTTLNELPPGRPPVTTHILSNDRLRGRAYERIREEVAKGNRAFVVCPLIEESTKLEAKAATVEYERLAKGPLAGLRLHLMHGRMRPAEKQNAMLAFAKGEADVLVCTTVVEVGIDVPDATVMMVENAERLGISQLHQLRGRIGRGTEPSVCLLSGPDDSRRLKALREHRDGFKLAEIDLELRGEGEMVGTRQHGEVGLQIASLPGDARLLERARARAKEILSEDPSLDRTPAGRVLREQLLPRHSQNPDQLLTG